MCSKEEAKVTGNTGRGGCEFDAKEDKDLPVGDYHASSQVANAVTRDPPAESQPPPLIHSSFTHLLM